MIDWFVHTLRTYPEIAISYQVVSGTGFVPAVATERRAGKYLWDVWHNGPPSCGQRLASAKYSPLRLNTPISRPLMLTILQWPGATSSARATT